MNGLPVTNRSQAVLIGTGHYQLLPDLHAVPDDLSALAQALQNDSTWALTSRNCAIVEDPVLAGDILDPLTRAAAEATDTLLAYYVGHALIDPSDGELYLSLTGSDPQQMHTAVPGRHILRNLFDSRASRRILILDCIYSEPAVGEAIKAIQALAASAHHYGTYLFAGVSKSVSTPSSARDPYTPFTGELLRITQRGVVGGDPLLDLKAIRRTVSNGFQAQGFSGPLTSPAPALGQLTLIHIQAYQTPWEYPTSGYPMPSWGAPPPPGSAADHGGPAGYMGSADRGESADYGPPAAQRPASQAPPSRRQQGPRVPPRSRQRSRERETANDLVSKAVQSAVHRGLLVFNPPEEMRQGHTDRVEVGVARSAALRESLLGNLHGRGLPQFAEVETSSFMSVELKGDAFQITSYSALEQIVAPVARWEFDVVPLQPACKLSCSAFAYAWHCQKLPNWAAANCRCRCWNGIFAFASTSPTAPAGSSSATGSGWSLRASDSAAG